MVSKRNASSPDVVEEVPVEEVGLAMMADHSPAEVEIEVPAPEKHASLPAATPVRDLAPKAWHPGVKFISKFRDYRLVVIGESFDILNGFRVRNPGFTAEFHAGEWTPKSENEYNLVAEKWRLMYAYLPQGASNNYNFIEAPDIAELVPKDYDMLRNQQGVEVIVGPRTVRASSRGNADRE